MPRRAWPAAALVAALALSPSLADVVAMSLEERLATAAVVVLGPMQAIAEAPPDARGLVRREGRIRAERVLKGDLAPGAVLTVALPPRGPGGRPTGADLDPPREPDTGQAQPRHEPSLRRRTGTGESRERIGARQEGRGRDS